MSFVPMMRLLSSLMSIWIMSRLERKVRTSARVFALDIALMWCKISWSAFANARSVLPRASKWLLQELMFLLCGFEKNEMVVKVRVEWFEWMTSFFCNCCSHGFFQGFKILFFIF